MLLAVPNVSEGRDADRVSAIGATFDAPGVSLLDTHSDPDHNRAVFTLAGAPGPLADALLSGAGAAIEAIDMRKHHGVHPCVGALDVCPVVWLDPANRDEAKAAALDVAERIGALGVPVFLYGELASGPGRSERSLYRRGGVAELTLRMGTGELPPDRGPAAPHPTAGATLVTARPPLAAFNVELDSAEPDVARSVAAELREGAADSPVSGRSGLRSRTAAPRSRPTSTTRSPRRWGASSPRFAVWPAATARGRWPPRSSGSCRRLHWPPTPTTSRSPASSRSAT